MNCDTWQGFGCRYDIKCRMNTNMNGLCSVNNDCAFGYYCIEDFALNIKNMVHLYSIDKNLMDFKR